MYSRIHYYKAIHYSNRTSPYWLHISSKTSQDWFFDWTRGPTNIALRLIYSMIKTLRIIKNKTKKMRTSPPHEQWLARLDTGTIS
ncbi:hypothetical protein L208DRAFT_1389659, partial [Tricholoma matsutake]